MRLFTITTMMLVAFNMLSSLVAGALLPAGLSSTANTTTPSLEWFGTSKGKNVTLYCEKASDIIAQLKELDPHLVPATSKDTATKSLVARKYVRYRIPPHQT